MAAERAGRLMTLAAAALSLLSSLLTTWELLSVDFLGISNRLCCSEGRISKSQAMILARLLKTPPEKQTLRKANGENMPLPQTFLASRLSPSTLYSPLHCVCSSDLHISSRLIFFNNANTHTDS